MKGEIAREREREREREIERERREREREREREGVTDINVFVNNFKAQHILRYINMYNFHI